MAALATNDAAPCCHSTAPAAKGTSLGRGVASSQPASFFSRWDSSSSATSWLARTAALATYFACLLQSVGAQGWLRRSSSSSLGFFAWPFSASQCTCKYFADSWRRELLQVTCKVARNDLPCTFGIEAWSWPR